MVDRVRLNGHGEAVACSLLRVDQEPADWRVVPGGPANREDAVLCRVLELGCYTEVEVNGGARKPLHPNILLVGVSAPRASLSSMHGNALTPDVAVGDQIDLLAESGIVGNAVDWSPHLSRPTTMRFLGRLVDEQGHSIRVPTRLTTPKALPTRFPPVILVGGAKSGVGKSYLLMELVRLLASKSINSCYCKLTGTGRLRDRESLRSAGAAKTIDFTDLGFASTYGLSSSTVLDIARSLLAWCASGSDAPIVAELGGDIISGGGAHILSDSSLQRLITLLILMPSEPFSAAGMISWLHGKDFESRIAIGPALNSPSIYSSMVHTVAGTTPISYQNLDAVLRIHRVLDALSGSEFHD